LTLAPAAGDHEGGDEDAEVGGEGRRAEHNSGDQQPGGQHDPLADPICREAPGEQGRHGAEVRRGEQYADPGQTEVVFGLESGREHRQPEEDGRVAPLGGRAEPEDRPAVPAHVGEATPAALP
jgi:hypothetical protein